MTILRPVTQRLPQSVVVSEQSNLPFSFVLAPYASNPLLSESEEKETTKKDDGEQKQEEELLLLPADSVPKCGSCGAPINPCSPIDAYPTKPIQIGGFQGSDDEYDVLEEEELESGEGCYGSFFCGLCGSTTSLHPSIQDPLHPSRLGKELYVARFQENAHNIFMALEKRKRETRQSGGWRSRVNLRKKHQDENTAYVRKFISPDVYPECHKHVMEYSVPLSTSPDRNSLVTEMDAADCPPVFTAVILDHDPKVDFPNYYSSVCHSIRLALKSAPPHAKIGIFLATYENITTFDLASPVPHFKHIKLPPFEANSQGRFFSTLSSPVDEDYYIHMNDDLEWDRTYVTCTPENKSNVESVLRALEDSLVVTGVCRPHSIHSNTSSPQGVNNQKKSLVPNLGDVLHHLLNYLECGKHPGDLSSSKIDGGVGLDGCENNMCFAGGKIMVFLPQAPAEIGEVVVENGGQIGTGGFGGSCAQVGRRFASSLDKEYAQFKDINDNNSQEVENVEKDEEQIMSEFMDYFLREKQDVADWYCDLGSRAAGLAMSFEIFGIQREENTTETKSFGFPLLRLLSDRSGGCGPLLVCLNEGTTGLSYNDIYDKFEVEGNGDGGTVAALFKEVLARCPWERPCAFGAMLRVRTSSSFVIDISPPTDENGEENQKTSFNRYHKTGGIIGPCTTNPFEPDLWHFGTCDLDTTVAFDMEIVSSSGLLVEKMTSNDGQIIDVPPCIQTCFMYTAVLPKQGGDGGFRTVRRLRVLTTNLKVAESTEQLSMSLDAEALAVVLFHKIISTSLLVGLRETRILGQNWLLATLLATYRSAERYYKEQRKRRYDVVTDEIPFYTGERLLPQHYPNSDGILSTRDILLGEGHELISSLPLMIFSLLNCDAIRPTTTSGFRPSLDARVAAAANMSIMSPSVLARAIAPRLELWCGNGREQRMDSIKMNRVALETALNEEEENEQFPIFFLDSPWQIMLYGDAENNHEDIDVNDAILLVLNEASASYRVAPPVTIALKKQEFSTENISSWERFSAAMLEDLDIGVQEHYHTDETENAYEAFCTKIVNTLYEEIIGNEEKKIT